MQYVQYCINSAVKEFCQDEYCCTYIDSSAAALADNICICICFLKYTVETCMATPFVPNFADHYQICFNFRHIRVPGKTVREGLLRIKRSLFVISKDDRRNIFWEIPRQAMFRKKVFVFYTLSHNSSLVMHRSRCWALPLTVATTCDNVLRTNSTIVLALVVLSLYIYYGNSVLYQEHIILIF